MTIDDQHAAACGTSPESADRHIGSFGSRYGGRLIFTFDRTTDAASLRGGDADWRNVRDGRVDGLILTLEDAERLLEARRRESVDVSSFAGALGPHVAQMTGIA